MIPSALLLLTDVLPEAYLFLEPGGQIIAASREAVKAFGPEGDPRDRNLGDLVQNTPEKLRRLLRAASRSRAPLPLPLRWKQSLAPALRDRVCEGFLVKPATKDDGAVLALRCRLGRRMAAEFAGLNRELDRHRAALRRLEESRAVLEAEHERALVTLRSIGDAVITTDAEGCVEFLNPVAEQLTRWSNEQARGLPIEEVFAIVHELTRQPAENPVRRCLRARRIVELANHTALIARDGSEFVIEDSAAPIITSRGGLLGCVLVFRDVTNDRLARRQLEYLARHDTLTGLYNRHHFEEQVEHAVQVAHRGEINYALLYIDLDQFKVVNDSAGHGAGDQLLTEVAAAFAGRARESDILARLGGDEFGVLLTNVTPETTCEVAQSFLESVMGFRFSWDGHRWDITASVGSTVIDAHTLTAAEAMRRADIACYVAKSQGRRRAHAYDPADEGRLSSFGDLNVLQVVRDALGEGRFSLYFQPIVQTKTRKPMIHEVLLRMPLPNGQVMMPTAFIPVAERYGLMAQIDRWVLEQAFAILEGYEPDRRPTLSINLSGSSLGDAKVMEVIVAKLDARSELASSLIFEITETAAVSRVDRAAEFMHALKRHGCRFALDDFGTGFSSLAYLKHLPIDLVKIDGAFVRDIVQDPVDQAMVRSINHIAHSLGKETVAEFVENEQILEALVEFGLDYVQGHHIGMPAPFLVRGS